jgi:phosphatidylserine/phosphatidylglycerophosphate/cardiolipin synthase-like enzyme
VRIDFLSEGRVNPTCIPTPPPILKPGSNCFAVSRARRAAVLVDAEEYFTCLEATLRRATRSIVIIGWDFDAATRLRPGEGDGNPLGELLRKRVDECPTLEVRILVWNLSTVHTPGASLPLIFGAGWSEHPRTQVWLDHNHPIYGSQHQKLVCIDDAIAFAGGIDLTIDRWDTRSHIPNDARRTKPDGTSYDPVHDIQMIVEGEAAEAVSSVARHRWRQATGEDVAPSSADRDLWPVHLPPRFRDVAVAVSRTMPAFGGDPEVREIRALVQDALSAAQHSVYLEAQYFADSRVGELLAESLAREAGPEIVAVIAHTAHGFLERWVMSSNRDRVIRQLLRADRFQRFRAYYPVIARPGGDCEIFIHSKLIIVDESFLRIGSANLNRRSSGLDTECDLSIEAKDGMTEAAIAAVRADLIAEHLGAQPEAVAVAIREHGLIRAVDALNNAGERLLRPYRGIKKAGSVRPVVGTSLLDPSKPFLLNLRRRKPRRQA